MKTREEITIVVRRVVAETIGYVPSDEFLFKSMELDSLDLVKLVLDVEVEFDVVVEDSEIGDLRCIRDVVDLVERKIKCHNKS